MVARFTSSRVPRFASLIDFMRAKKLYYRALYMPCPAPGPERSSFDLRFQRHRLQPEGEIRQPGFSSIQNPFKHEHKIHIKTHYGT